jgi:hypothetical protein
MDYKEVKINSHALHTLEDKFGRDCGISKTLLFPNNILLVPDAHPISAEVVDSHLGAYDLPVYPRRYLLRSCKRLL